mmetsp:Transcript_131535/g.232402  ORF Transcript_131535/g.232402 Transcript_131535/m.232402 type:complete len:90 (+) Transcript_131535:1207-1476(+)
MSPPGFWMRQCCQILTCQIEAHQAHRRTFLNPMVLSGLIRGAMELTPWPSGETGFLDALGMGCGTDSHASSAVISIGQTWPRAQGSLSQ